MFKRLIFIKKIRKNFIFNFSSSPKDFVDIANTPNLDIDTKIQQLEQNQPLFVMFNININNIIFRID